MPPLCLSIPGAADTLCCSRSQIYRLLAAGHLRSIKIGRRSVIPLESIQKFIAATPEAIPPGVHAT
jgi:excisionase family DNA binding protein